jgi:hypothetical protein
MRDMDEFTLIREQLILKGNDLLLKISIYETIGDGSFHSFSAAFFI